MWLLCAGLTAGARATTTLPDATSPTHGAAYEDGPADRWRLGGVWLYRADPTDVGVADDFYADTPDTTGWTPTTVPNSFNVGDLSTASQDGAIGWYRRDFTLPRHAFPRRLPHSMRRWMVGFDSVNASATVWLDGVRIGAHDGAYEPFELPLSGLSAGGNELVVRVSSIRTAAALPPGPGGHWFNYGGINRDVELRAVAAVDLSPVIVRPILRCPTCAARVHERVTAVNHSGVAQRITLSGRYGPRGRLRFGTRTIAPHGRWVAHATLRVRHPHRWSPADPYLYRATVTATGRIGHGRAARRQRLALYTVQSGIRSIHVARDGRLLLNGRVLHLRGFSIQEQNQTTGDALTSSQLNRLVAWDRSLGGEVLRAHYPLNSLIEQDADRDGILLWNEIPAYQPTKVQLRSPAWLRRAHRALRTDILTNEDHPSILTWSIGNELPAPPTRAEGRYVRGAVRLAHRLDPTRPVSMATIWYPGGGCQAAYRPLDLIGINDYIGWFESSGGLGDDPAELSPTLDATHRCYPHSALMVTEFGFEGSRRGPADVKGTYAYQAAMARYHLHVFAEKPWLAGALWLAMQDFAAYPGWSGGDPVPHSPYVEKGPITLDGRRREPLFGVLSQIFHRTRQVGR